MNDKPQRPPRPKMDFKMLGRVMGYIFKYYKIQMAIVFVCIILNTLASVGGNLYLQVLILLLLLNLLYQALHQNHLLIYQFLT